MIVRIRLSFEIEAIRRVRLQVIYLTFDNLEILNNPLSFCYKGPTSKILMWRKTSGMDTPPRREPSPRERGGSLPRAVGRGGFPAPPCKNDQNRGEVAGQNKYPNLNFLQKRKQVMEQYYNTEQCPIQPVNRICKRK